MALVTLSFTKQSLIEVSLMVIVAILLFCFLEIINGQTQLKNVCQHSLVREQSHFRVLKWCRVFIF